MASLSEIDSGTPLTGLSLPPPGPGRKELALSDSRTPFEVLRSFALANAVLETNGVDGKAVREAVVGFVAEQPDGLAGGSKIAKELFGVLENEPRFDGLVSYLGELCRLGQLLPVAERGYAIRPDYDLRKTSKPEVATTTNQSSVLETVEPPLTSGHISLDSALKELGIRSPRLREAKRHKRKRR